MRVLATIKETILAIAGLALFPLGAALILLNQEHRDGLYYIREIPAIGQPIHDAIYPDRNHPEWREDYTTHPAVLNNITWHYDSLTPCSDQDESVSR